MLVDALQQHEVEEQVNRMVEKVRGIEIKREMVEVAKEVAEVANKMPEVAKELAEVAKEVVEVVKKVIRVVKVIVEVMEQMEVVVEFLTLLPSSGTKLVELPAGHVAYTNRFHELARLVPHLVTPENKRIERYIYGLASQIRVMVVATEPTTIQSVILKARMLTNEVIRNGALKKIFEKRGNNRELSRDGNVRDDNKRSSLEGRLPQSQIML
ncbi:hypothetical protein Tco_0364758 [Tanacetum coccineum]